jgi:nucleoside-diphosphate-sugar epimerase
MAAILLTGATGYIGGAIAEELERRGLPYTTLTGRLETLAPGSLRGYRHVIHAAGAPRYRGQPAIDIANRLGTERLVAALGGEPSLLFLSSRSVYGHQFGKVCRESDPATPSEPYGEAKLAAERAVAASGLEHVIARIPSVIGACRTGIGHSFLAFALRRFMEDAPIVRYLPDRQHDSLDLLALTRLCADWAAGDRPLPAGVLNVSGRHRSLHGTLAQFAAVASRHGRTPRIEDQVGPPMPWPFMSDARFCTELGALAEHPDDVIAQACWERLAG